MRRKPRPVLPKEYGVAYSEYRRKYFVFVKVKHPQYVLDGKNPDGYDTLREADAAYAPSVLLRLPNTFLNGGRSDW